MDQRRDARAGAARHGKITLDDVFWSISTERLTGDTAGCGQVVPLHHPRRTALRMMWHAPAGPVTAPLMPVFLGQSSVPPAYRQHRYLTSGESHRFPDRRKETENPDTVSPVPQGIETGPSAFYAFKRLMHLAFQAPDPTLAEVRHHWRAVEAKANARIPGILRAASLLLDAGEAEVAVQSLDEFGHARLAEALADCEALPEAAHARLRAPGLSLHKGRIGMRQARSRALICRVDVARARGGNRVTRLSNVLYRAITSASVTTMSSG